ncbi:uncharacterized protein LOC134054368 [Cinclus cinclus]|uniref:uncharacterized protein LOC134054368 n=1 Tax=Cinclus cinclus TaxID=127875 RepID=UPI002E1256FD
MGVTDSGHLLLAPVQPISGGVGHLNGRDEQSVSGGGTGWRYRDRDSGTGTAGYQNIGIEILLLELGFQDIRTPEYRDIGVGIGISSYRRWHTALSGDQNIGLYPRATTAGCGPGVSPLPAGTGAAGAGEEPEPCQGAGVAPEGPVLPDRRWQRRQRLLGAPWGHSRGRTPQQHPQVPPGRAGGQRCPLALAGLSPRTPWGHRCPPATPGLQHSALGPRSSPGATPEPHFGDTDRMSPHAQPW